MYQQDEHQFLTVAEAAETKAVTRAAIYLAVSQGRLPSKRIMGRIALAAADVAVWNPTPNSGRPIGIPVSDATRLNLSRSQKRRWAVREEKNGTGSRLDATPPVDGSNNHSSA